jgi:hypothetical protein
MSVPAPRPRFEAERTVIVAGDTLDPELTAAVEEACARVGARSLDWGRQTGEGPAPLAVVAALPAGERQIPDRLMRLLTAEHQEASLLLLCRELLVRPSVTLRNGRVTLVEAPLTPRRIASRLRVLLAREPSTLGHGELTCLEHQRPGYWLGALVPADHEGDRSWLDQRRGLTALIPSPDEPPAPDRLDRASALVARGGDAERLGHSLLELVGNTALVHLGPRGEEWLFYWPGQQPLWLCSPQRLPALWDLAANAEEHPTRCFRVPAASGDVALALAATPAGWQAEAARPGLPGQLPAELRDAVADGGPALLDEVEERMAVPAGLVSALVVEAR